VENVSLRVGRGEIDAFLGLNGAGKTTTTRMLLGMIWPSAGVAFLLGHPVHIGAVECVVSWDGSIRPQQGTRLDGLLYNSSEIQ
jgi:ABC-type Mn2+/Zn2+ transport system ATPase subunit